MRYVVRGYATGRICLTMQHGQLAYFRGPLLHHDLAQLAPYAKGCFSVGQPITLQGLGTGMYSLAAELRSATDETVLADTSLIFFAVVAIDENLQPFVPTYEWQEVQEGQ